MSVYDKQFRQRPELPLKGISVFLNLGPIFKCLGV